MPIEIILPTDEKSWHAARSRDVTASVAAGLMGIHPYSTPYQLWAEKTGRAPRDSRETKAMRRGTLLEPVAVQVLAEDYPEWEIIYRNDRAYYRDTDARIGATPDVFVRRPDFDGMGIVQIKTVSAEAFKGEWQDPDTRDVVPPTWIAVQAIIEAVLTGATSAAVGALIWNRDALDLHVLDVPIHTKLFRTVAKRVDEFWAFVATGEEMDPDWGRDGRAVLSVYGESRPDRLDLTDMTGIDQVIDRYLAAGAVIREAEKIRETLKPQLIFALGNSEAGFTDRYNLTAPTIRKAETTVRETQYRGLRIKPRRDR